ncbi:MAG: hypothetical protein M3Z56_01405 [Bacteroidota bacterium]|nr:hypothetical protein [Bacteroidota bacterium]
MKYYKLIGFTGCALLILSCFLPWTYYADIHKTFNGFFSEANNYGKPGKFFIFFAVLSAFLIYSDKVWAKRTHIFLSALAIGYLIKTYILFTSCYNAYCPEKRAGLYLLIASCLLLMIVSVFPDVKISVRQNEEIKDDF